MLAVLVPEGTMMLVIIQHHTFHWGPLFHYIFIRLPRNSSRLSGFRITGNCGGSDGADDNGWARKRPCAYSILPHNARRHLSIIAVQVKVEVEHIVKSSEFTFHELRVNETCLFLEEGNLVAWSPGRNFSALRLRSSLTKKQRSSMLVCVGGRN
jgi:hypothetical protein